MLDPKLLREDLDSIAKKLTLRGFDLDVTVYKKLEGQRKSLQQVVENLQASRNSTAKIIGEHKKNNQDTTDLEAHASKVSVQMNEKKRELTQIQLKMKNLLEEIPNVTDSRVPSGSSEDDNVVHSQWGEPRKFGFEPSDHVKLCENKGWLDFPIATQLSSSRFSVLKGPLALLHRALAQFMLNLHTQEHDYEEINPPVVVNSDTLFGTGQLPKFETDLFAVHSGDKALPRELYLIPTAEVTLTNLVAKQILSKHDLPRKLTAHTLCFRSEAGNSGRDTRGLIRQHQFEKIELVQICEESHSWQVLEEMTQHAEKVLQLLKLPYRRIILCTGDIGFCSAFTYDLEVWIPSQNVYREISSISNCLDFQARRMQARYRDENDKIKFVHTLNGSGVAVGRAMLAVLENYQRENGDITVPDALRPYMRGLEFI